jgi:hypothetical protein
VPHSTSVLSPKSGRVPERLTLSLDRSAACCEFQSASGRQWLAAASIDKSYNNVKRDWYEKQVMWQVSEWLTASNIALGQDATAFSLPF